MWGGNGYDQRGLMGGTFWGPLCLYLFVVVVVVCCCCVVVVKSQNVVVNCGLLDLLY